MLFAMNITYKLVLYFYCDYSISAVHAHVFGSTLASRSKGNLETAHILENQNCIYLNKKVDQALKVHAMKW